MEPEKNNSDWQMPFGRPTKQSVSTFHQAEPEGSQCQIGMKYNYSSLFKPGSSGRTQIADWIRDKMFENDTYAWGKGFSPSVSTGLKTSDDNQYLDWGDLVHNVLNRIDAQVVSERDGRAKLLTWTKEDWQDALNLEQEKCVHLNQFDSGKRVLFVVMCIMTGLIEGKNEQDTKFRKRGRMCDIIDTNLEFTEDQWEEWIKPTSDMRKSPLEACSKQKGYHGCQEAAMALILSIYGGMKEVYQEYGPYHLTYWMKKGKSPGHKTNVKMCSMKEDKMECLDFVASDSQAGKIQIGGDELEEVFRTKSFELREQLETVEETGEDERDHKEVDISEFPGRVRSAEGLNTEQSDSERYQESYEEVLIRKDATLEASRRQVQDNETLDKAKDSKESLSSFTEGEDTIRMDSSGPANEHPTPPQEDERFKQEEAGRDEDKSLFLLAGLEGWKLIAGLAGVVCMAFAGGYGMWRVFNRGGRRSSSRPRGREISLYQVGYGAPSC
ncbi:hypothetical protein C922_05751 [Plasmodium inui San Antonio 1]|uniref:Uncharacterized protein n=1 Tax=Plasmodium inui San Antonio 1 TaxID=1237626 RepID=W6ZX80_9APIC|nr:hypothetical protein C922_05751 [Plasmodium inui San Antonio 1]EUD63870.1 hypothetical protein C922_05751 [Plasmodium inui San Antonio 1]